MEKIVPLWCRKCNNKEFFCHSKFKDRCRSKKLQF